ncbi:hypothetical protein [Fluviicola sp.]|uniref:hypothetical protein n=1 Tax=Fluviicola sp. TaxID=1917219 RepID=UPI0031CF83E1
MEIITLIITVLLGIPGVIIFVRSKKTKLYFIKDKQINLQDDLLKNFENLTIKYNDVEINDKITFIKGHVLCLGNKDLTEKVNKIEISADEIIWLDFKITNTSKGVEITSTIKKEKVILEFGLLKDKEWVEFEGIINNNNSFVGQKRDDIKLSFFHRIPNLPKITEFDKSKTKDIISRLVMGSFTMLFGLFTFYDGPEMTAYNSEMFNSRTGNKISSVEIIHSECNDSILEKLNDDYIGYKLFFSKSKTYKLVCRDIKSKKEIRIDVFYRRVWDSDLIDMFFSIFLLLGGTYFIVSSFRRWNQKSYFKYLNN